MAETLDDVKALAKQVKDATKANSDALVDVAKGVDRLEAVITAAGTPPAPDVSEAMSDLREALANAQAAGATTASIVADANDGVDEAVV